MQVQAVESPPKKVCKKSYSVVMFGDKRYDGDEELVPVAVGGLNGQTMARKYRRGVPQAITSSEKCNLDNATFPRYSTEKGQHRKVEKGSPLFPYTILMKSISRGAWIAISRAQRNPERAGKSLTEEECKEIVREHRDCKCKDCTG